MSFNKQAGNNEMKTFDEIKQPVARGCGGPKLVLLLFGGIAPTVALAGDDGNGSLIFVQFLVYALVGGLVVKVIKWRKDDARERAYEESLEDGDEGEDERTADDDGEDESYENARWYSRRRNYYRRRSPWRTFKLVVLLLALSFLALLVVGIVIDIWLKRS